MEVCFLLGQLEHAFPFVTTWRKLCLEELRGCILLLSVVYLCHLTLTGLPTLRRAGTFFTWVDTSGADVNATADIAHLCSVYVKVRDPLFIEQA